ncbi:Protein SPT10 [Madurella mycetomatis]|uniref:Protein SPT10 n=1 Tax=Madurella mycetomatis TaxID=100816 RepID=A0A175W076_9PEZI|nr:Protein SPT10 [Madurella mycetomatis]
MPAILDDPAAPTIFRVSGDPPYPDPASPSLPPTITPRHVTLRDRQTVATVVPFASRHQVPESLLRYLSDQFNKEIEGGDTYPMLDPMPFDKFASYWFQNFGGIMLLGNLESAADVVEGKDWSKECLGTFYIKPNYPGRSSHICNAGFIVTDASRNRGVGRLMGETYLEWAPKLGYKYSVFNLVYETNVASCKIWDALGFKRIGRVKGAGNLKSHPDRLVDAIIYGRDLGDAAGGAGNEELVSEERFDKIKFYLKYGRYPNGADRAEKSRLRSAATHYKLLDGDILMLKDKEVISDPQRQYEIARGVHNQAHAGINKTTATIAERYHWSRIKETVSDVIRNCAECKDAGKASSTQTQQPSPGVSTNGLKRPNLSPAPGASTSKRSSPSPQTAGPPPDVTAATGRPGLPMSTLPDPAHLSPFTVPPHHQFTDPTAISILPPPAHALQTGPDTAMADTISRDNPMLQDTSHGPLHPPPHGHHHHPHSTHAPSSHQQVALPAISPGPHDVRVAVPVPVYQPIDPQIMNQPPAASEPHGHLHHHHHYPFGHPSPPPHPHPHDPDADADTFQALLSAADVSGADDEDDVVVSVVVDMPAASTASHHHPHPHPHPSPSPHPHHPHGTHAHAHAQPAKTKEEDEAEQAAVDRDMEMLIESQGEDDEHLPVSVSVPGQHASGRRGSRAGTGTGTGTGRKLERGLGLGPGLGPG